MKNQFIYIFLSLFIAGVGCKKSKTNEIPTPNIENTMSGTLNGQEWKADDKNSMHIFLKKDTVKGIEAETYYPPKYRYNGLSIIFCRKETDASSSMLTIDIDSLYAPKNNTYSFDVKYPNLPYAYFMPTIENDNYLYDLLVYGNTKGFVKITKFDLVNKKISGSFDISQKVTGYPDYIFKGSFTDIDLIEKY